MLPIMYRRGEIHRARFFVINPAGAMNLAPTANVELAVGNLDMPVPVLKPYYLTFKRGRPRGRGDARRLVAFSILVRNLALPNAQPFMVELSM